MSVPDGGGHPVPLTPGGIADHASCLLLKVGQVAYRLTEDALARWGLRTRHYSVLQALSDRGALSQQDLVALLRIDRATMVAAVDDLEAKGLAVRERSARDRRRYDVTLTAGGAQVLGEVRAALTRLDQVVLADLDPAARGALTAALRALGASPSLVGAFDAVRGGQGAA